MLTTIEYDDTIGFVLVDKSPAGLANSKRHKKRTKKMATEAQNVESVKEQQLNAMQTKVDAINNDRGAAKGTRLKVGQTRGKGSQIITFEAFDESKPELLPKSIAEFMQLAKIEQNEAGEQVLVSYLIDGYNSQSYANASDPIAEYIEPTWTPEQQKAFKMVVKNFASALQIPVEDAVNQIKPNFVAGLAKRQG